MLEKRKPYTSVLLILLVSVGSLFIFSFRDAVYPKTDTAFSSAESTERSLWVGERKGAIGLSVNNVVRFLEIPADRLEDIVVDVARGVVWVGTRKEIRRYSYSGEEISRYLLNIRNDCGERIVHISLNQSDGSLWVGAKEEVIRLSPEGEELFRIRTENHIVDLSVDSSDGACWVGFKRSVTKYSPEGMKLLTHNMENCNPVYALAADPLSRTLWIGAKKGLMKAGIEGIEFRIAEPLDIQDLKIDMSDSSLWAVTKKEVYKYSHEGQKLLRLAPCSKHYNDSYHKKALGGGGNYPMCHDDDNSKCEGNLVTLAVDPYDSICWVAWRRSLLKLSPDGEFLQRLDGFKQIEALDIGYSSAPLSIRIGSPLDGEVLFDTPVHVSGTVSDTKAEVSVNDFDAAVSGNTFTITDLMLQEGPNVITAVAADKHGRTA
ncbi:MAG: hypothetical protein AB1442_08355, partial [Nitrospirota bacterium]